MRLVEPVLNRMCDAEHESVPGDTILYSFRLLLMIHLTAGYVIQFWVRFPIYPLAMCLLCLLATRGRQQRLALALASIVQLHNVYTRFPIVANHLWLETLMVLVLTFLGDSDEESVLFRQFTRWVTVIALFYSGFQKLWYGSYFDGQFIALYIADYDHYRDFFAFFLSGDEIARLVSYLPIRAGSGPFRVDSVPYLVIVNTIWINEILAAILLFFRRTRFAGLIFGILVVIGIEVVAREICFGILFSCMLLTFNRQDVIKRVIPCVVIAYLYLIGVHFNVLPDFTFYP